MNPSRMGQLYPIIRRIRRPLLPVDAEAPKPAPEPSKQPKQPSEPELKKTLVDSIDASANANN